MSHLREVSDSQTAPAIGPYLLPISPSLAWQFYEGIQGAINVGGVMGMT